METVFDGTDWGDFDSEAVKGGQNGKEQNNAASKKMVIFICSEYLQGNGGGD